MQGQKKRPHRGSRRCLAARAPCAAAPAQEAPARSPEVSAHKPTEAVCERQKAKAGAKASGSQLETALAVILTVHCARNAPRRAAFAKDDESLRGSSLFQEAEEPELSIRDFLVRIRRSLHCSKECFILALIYIDRAVDRCPGLTINSLTVHRLLLSGILVASKYMDDHGFDNAHYAKVGGMTTNEMNGLEVALVHALGWRLHVPQDEYAWYSDLACRVGQRE